MDDTWVYHVSAIRLMEGKGYVLPWSGAQTSPWLFITGRSPPQSDTATTLWPPGYTFLLAGIYKIFGPSVAVAWGTNIVLGAVTCVLAYLLGCLILRRSVGAIAGLLLAVFPGHVFFSSLLMSEVLFTFLVTVAMALILMVARRQGDVWPWLLLAGATIGATALVRGQGLFLIPLATLFWWLHQGNWLQAIQRGLLVTAASLIVILPWTVRNYAVAHSLVPISANAGADSYMGNHEGATGRFMFAVDAWIYQRVANLPSPEAEVAVGNFALREGLRFMFTHPQEELHLTATKAKALYEDDTAGLRWIHHPEVGRAIESLDSITHVANTFYFAVLAVSAGGLLYWVRHPRSGVALPLLVVAVFTLGQLLFFGNSPDE